MGGVPYNTNAHQMAVGSEVDLLAKTNHSSGGPGDSTEGDGSPGATRNGSAGRGGMSVFASLHRKLIVQQV